MASRDSTNDFVVTVDGIGTFTFAKKTMRTQMAIESEYSRLTEGVETVTNFLGNVANAMACLKVQTVSSPDGWNIETMDPEDTDSYVNIMKVWGALRDKQATFERELSRALKAIARERAKSLEFWYRKKFNFAPTDPRFLDTTLEEMAIENWTWFYDANPVMQEDEDDDFDLEKIRAEMENPDAWEPVK